MNYDELFRKLLDNCIKYNSVENYLLGKFTSYVREDPNSSHTHHAFDYAVKVYNEVNNERPKLGLSSKFVEILLEELSKENLGNVDVYSIFRCLLAQLRLEREGKASFNLSKENKEKLLRMIKEKIELMKEMLKQSKYAEGDLYEEGLYGYLNKAYSEYYNKTGNKII